MPKGEIEHKVGMRYLEISTFHPVNGPIHLWVENGTVIADWVRTSDMVFLKQGTAK